MRSEFRLGLAFLRRQDPQILLEDLARSRFRDRIEDKDASAEALVVRELLLDVLGHVLLEGRRLGVIRVGDNCTSGMWWSACMVLDTGKVSDVD